MPFFFRALLLLLYLLGQALLADPGHLVLMGGGEKPQAAMVRFIELAGGKQAPIVVLPTASEDPRTAKDYRSLLAEYGCTQVLVLPIKTAADARNPKFLPAIQAARGIFFSGGDQRRITAALLGSPLLAAIQTRFDEGIVLAGTSAGTACMSALMITGEGHFDQLRQNSVELGPGLGFAKGVVLDQHFIARGRQNRLLSLIMAHPDLLGVGVDEHTAIWIKPDQTLEVLGRGWVQIYDARGASLAASTGKASAQAVRDLAVHILIEGDRYDLAHAKVLTFAGVDSSLAKETIQ